MTQTSLTSLLVCVCVSPLDMHFEWESTAAQTPQCGRHRSKCLLVLHRGHFSLQTASAPSWRLKWNLRKSKTVTEKVTGSQAKEGTKLQFGLHVVSGVKTFGCCGLALSEERWGDPPLEEHLNETFLQKHLPFLYFPKTQKQKWEMTNMSVKIKRKHWII